jgi:iron(III) transport system substrate-binding protein
MYATAFASLSPIGYNTNLVKPEDAPTTFADLLDPRWQGKIVKGNPDYSGTVFTATFALARDLGWSYFERLAQQKVVQVQDFNGSESSWGATDLLLSCHPDDSTHRAPGMEG